MANSAPTFKIGTGSIALAGFDDHTRTSLAIDGQGGILIGNTPTRHYDTEDVSVTRLNADGTFDFFTEITNTDTGERGLEIFARGDGKVVAFVAIYDGEWSDENGIYAIVLDEQGSIVGSERVGSAEIWGEQRGAMNAAGELAAVFLTYGSGDEAYYTLAMPGGESQLSLKYGSSDYAVSDLALANDNTAILIGQTGPTSNRQLFVARYEGAGIADADFGGGDGIVTLDLPGTQFSSADVEVLADNKILVSGYDGSNSILLRFTASGDLDLTFGGGTGKVVTPPPSASAQDADIRVTPDGKILMVFNGAVMRLNSDGSLDTSYGSGDGVVLFNAPRALTAITPDGGIVVIGTNAGSSRIYRFTPDGEIDATFGGGDSLGGSIVLPGDRAPVYLDANVAIFDPELSALNSGQGNFSGASITLSRDGGADASDVFAITPASGSSFSVTANSINVGGATVATYTMAGGTLAIAFTNSGGTIPTSALVNQILRSITFNNTATGGPAATYQINWLFNDGNTGGQGTGGALTTTGQTTVNMEASNDLLYGNAASDILAGGPGDDTYRIFANATIVENAGQGFDTVAAAISYQLQAGVSIERLMTNGATGTSAINLTGNELSQEIIGNAGNNILRGGGGADLFRGNAGNDTYYVDSADDRVSERVNEGTDTVAASVSYALSTTSHVEVLKTTSNSGTAAIDLTGNELAQTIVGNAGANTLRGLAGDDTLNGLDGNDVLDGGLGADTLIGGAGTDRATYVNASAAVIVNLSNPGLNAGEAAGDTYSSIENLWGSSFNDTLTGDAGANSFVGDAGADILLGLGGNDSLYGGDGNDTLDGGLGGDYLSGGGGSDRATYINATSGLTVSLTTPAQNTGEAAGDTYNSVENLTGSNFDDILVGSAVANRISGSSGNDQVSGMAGDDVLFGNAGNDRLDGGLGADTLEGNAGQDTFVFTTTLGSGNVDTITDFVIADDTIELHRSIFGGIATAGVLEASAFHVGAAATDASDRIVYNSFTGALWYDADGNGAGAAVQFAQLAPALSLTNADFFVV